MRVLHLYSGNLYGGVETLLATFARTQAGTGLTHAFALAFEGRLADELRAMGADLSVLGAVRLSRPWTVLRARHALRGLLASARPDVVICHSAWSLAVFGPAVRKARLPLVFWLHDAVYDPKKVDLAARRVVPDLAICTSRFAESTLPKLFPDLPSVVVHPPVSPLPSFPEEDRNALRHELHTARRDAVIVQVARMEAWKGHGLLVDAMVEMADEPGWSVWFVGGAQRPEEAEYRAWIFERCVNAGLLERVRFLGERDDVPRVLAAADIFCAPNGGPEPFGVAMVEALYAGLPVVAFGAGGALEVVDETCGVLVHPPGASVRLADALRRLVRNGPMRRRLGEAGPARAVSLSDPATQQARLRDALAPLAARRREA